MTAEKKLAKIAKIYETITKKGRRTITTHAYYNMLGALLDIERTGKCDRVALKTLKSVHRQLGRIGNVLNERA
jgi:uncharacterized phage-associated protein